ncbi:MAG: rod shape-determining protein MreC [Streptosporangiales bacterium]|nr:rod shape-determining protein MreC [Streptosporangiales bacterium]
MQDTRRTRVILGLLLLAAFGMIMIDYRGGESSPLSGLRGLGATVFGPIERGAAAVTRPVERAWETISGAPEAQSRIRTLEGENERLREQLRQRGLDKTRADELSRLLHLSGLGRYKVVAAQAVALRGAQGYEDTLTIDVGSDEGVKTDMTVLNGDGLVGRVTQVGPSTSTVLLITDAASQVGARLEGSKEIGLVSGRGKGLSGEPLIRFQLLDSTAELKPGDRITSFGSQANRPYVPGVPIGVVQRVEKTPGALSRSALVRPYVRFTTLDVLGVVVGPPDDDPRDAVLPPTATPVPTVTVTVTPGATPKPGESPTPSGNPPSTPPASPSGTSSRGR